MVRTLLLHCCEPVQGTRILQALCTAKKKKERRRRGDRQAERKDEVNRHREKMAIHKPRRKA